VSARVARARVPPARKHPRIEGELPRDRRDESTDSTSARRKSIALGFILSAEHFSDRSAGVARQKTRHSAIGQFFCETIRAAARQIGAGNFTGSISEVARLFMAGKCSRTAKRNGVRS